MWKVVRKKQAEKLLLKKIGIKPNDKKFSVKTIKDLKEVINKK